MFVTQLRLALAITAGVIVTILLSYVALIVFVLITVGIPLGAESRPLTATGASTLLVVAAAASAIGARTAARIAGAQHRVAMGGVGIVLTVMMIWGFSGRNSWPDWWGPAVGIAMSVGCLLGAFLQQRRRQPM